MALKFIDYKVINATFSLSTDIATNKNYKIKPKISCTIKKQEGNRIIVNFVVEISRIDEPIPFEFKVDAVGSFAYDEGDDVALYTSKVAEVVYPFVRSSVAGLTQMANIPSYMMPLVDMDEILSKGKRIVLSAPTTLN